jgi:hypothetical protein
VSDEGPAFPERIHPSWITGTPPPAGIADDVRRWFERGRLGRLADMIDGDATELVLPDDLARIPPAELRRVIEVVGRKKLALVAQAAPSGAARLLAAQLGTEAPLFMAEVAARAPKDDVSAAVRRLASLLRRPPLLFRAGATWIAPWLASRGRSFERVVAQRLPRELGILLLDTTGKPGDGAWADLLEASSDVTASRAPTA